MTSKPDPMKLEELPEIAMQGPIEITMTVHCITADGKKARMEMFMQPGAIPSQEKIKAILDSSLTGLEQEIGGIPAGTRWMTKPEFVAYITKRDTGQSTPMPGNQEFEPVPKYEPLPENKNMLIHAILGTGGPAYEDVGKWIARGVAEDADGLALWTIGLEKLDEAQLLELYHEITAG